MNLNDKDVRDDRLAKILIVNKSVLKIIEHLRCNLLKYQELFLLLRLLNAVI